MRPVLPAERSICRVMPSSRVPSGQERNSVAPTVASYELLLYILTNFATVAGAKDCVLKILVNQSPQAVFKMPVRHAA